MTRDDYCKKLWNYYLVLESDFAGIERYLSFYLGDNFLYDDSEVSDYGNSLAYSVELIKQYQTICSEIDVILKVICAKIGRLEKENMREGYTPLILTSEYWRDIVYQKVLFGENELQPFRNWSNRPTYKSPDWWGPYNEVKHDRINNLKKANLKNVVNALAGLYVLEMYLVKYIGNGDNDYDVPNDISRLFKMNDWETRHTVVGRDSYFATKEEIDNILNSDE